MKELIMNILTNLIQLGILAVITYVVGFLRSKLGEANLKKYAYLVEIAVKSIEQQMSGADGESKKEAVKQYLLGKLGKVLTEEDINHLIEAAVYELNKDLIKSGKTSN